MWCFEDLTEVVVVSMAVRTQMRLCVQLSLEYILIVLLSRATVRLHLMTK